MTDRLAGKVIVLTGGAQGIGRGCALMLAQEGARVVIGDIDAAGGERTVQTIRDAGGDAIFIATDVTREEDCAALIDGAIQRYGCLNALVNVVGWFPRATLEETTTELWEAVLAVNLRSAFYCSKYAVPHLRDAGGGSIVNIGSIHGVQGAANVVAYSAAKGGLLTMTRTLAGALANDRIRVNYVIPGWVLTDTEIALQESQGTDRERLVRAGEGRRLGRHQIPEDTAYAVVYLTSDESTQVTGVVLNVDAGDSTLPLAVPPGIA
jgi:NAD(P)-dependent dehydrogenase (short-subunit alcohol dehydrogenase family)